MNDWLNVSNFVQQLEEEVLVASHVSPDGDALGSTLAVAEILRAFGKKVVMVNDSPIPERFKFLDGIEQIVSPDKVTKTFQSAVIVDCGDLERVASVKQMLAPNCQILNIDHHRTNPDYGTLNVVHPEAAATCEIIYLWIKAEKIKLTLPLAEMIYTGILTDTGSFRNTNTTAQVLHIAAELLDVGIDAHKIAELAMERMTPSQLCLLGKSLETLQQTSDGRIAWLSITKEMWQACQAERGDEEGLVYYARNLEGSLVGAFFWEREDGVKLSLRSSCKEIDLGAFTKSLGGGGHRGAAGCLLSGDLEAVQDEVLTKLTKFINFD